MKIAVAQLAPIIGAFDKNKNWIEAAYLRAEAEGADLLLTPELGLCGYLPLDLLLRPEMIARTQSALQWCLEKTRGKHCALVVGHVAENPRASGRPLLNQVSVLHDGKVVFEQAKTLLPTYDVFDEARYFEPAESIQLWTFQGQKIALGICEDLWAKDASNKRPRYSLPDPTEIYQKLGAELVLSCSASPYHFGKFPIRREIHQEVAKRLACPLIYVNQVGANDEILFDGRSFAVNAQGETRFQLEAFQEDFGICEWNPESGSLTGNRLVEAVSPLAELADALVVGIRDYFKRSGFKKALLGLSGGIDSAVVATLATKALGADNVIGLAMASQVSSGESLADAEALAKNLRIQFEVKPIKFLFSNFKRELSEGRDPLADLALENLQSRIRGMTLMTLANHENALVLCTSNKSEIATGYGTLYGDMIGALAPIGDLFKSRVYELANWINQNWDHPIPDRSICKEPTAELRPNQKDTDSLPPYAQLDPFLEDYLEKNKTQATEPWMKDVLNRVERNEYKRRQCPMVLRVSGRAFGLGRRIPIAKAWDAY